MPPRRAADVLHDLFCRFLHRPGFLSHLRSLQGYDEPEILPSSTRRICLIGADAGQQAVSIPVAANGDCASLADTAAILAQSGADAVMIGRSAIGRPWFVGDVAYYLAHGKSRAEPPPAERKSAALEHYETLLEVFGTGQGSRHARKHLAAYAERAGVLDGAALRQRLVRLECPSAVRATLCQ